MHHPHVGRAGEGDQTAFGKALHQPDPARHRKRPTHNAHTSSAQKGSMTEAQKEATTKEPLRYAGANGTQHDEASISRAEGARSDVQPLHRRDTPRLVRIALQGRPLDSMRHRSTIKKRQNKIIADNTAGVRGRIASETL